VPLEQRRAERLGDLDRQHGLAGARLALDQQWPLQRNGGIDRDLEVVGGDIGPGAVKAHANPLARRCRKLEHAELVAHKAARPRCRTLSRDAKRNAGSAISAPQLGISVPVGIMTDP
jgi:hypothetical protein